MEGIIAQVVYMYSDTVPSCYMNIQHACVRVVSSCSTGYIPVGKSINEHPNVLSTSRVSCPAGTISGEQVC